MAGPIGPPGFNDSDGLQGVKGDQGPPGDIRPPGHVHAPTSAACNSESKNLKTLQSLIDEYIIYKRIPILPFMGWSMFKSQTVL